RMLNNNSVEVFLKLFDAQVQPIVQYGSELWGLDKAAMHIEKVHLFALKKFLALDMRTPNDLVYGETDRFPITLNSAIRCIRYWLKLTCMDEDRLPRKAYLMLYNLDARGKRNWASNVRMQLFQYGFGFVWMNQGVGVVSNFIRVFRERLIDCRWQNWEDHIQTSDRFSMYRKFNSISHCTKTYITMNMDRHLKCIMTKFRLGVSELSVHYYRYRNHTEENLICPFCKEMKEDEVHFVLCCPVLDDLRKQYIPPKFCKNPCCFRLSLLLASTNQEIIRKLSLFLYKAFKIRDTIIS
ncbi:hypothetical protein, partial [Thiolapillus sp.]